MDAQRTSKNLTNMEAWKVKSPAFRKRHDVLNLDTKGGLFDTVLKTSIEPMASFIRTHATLKASSSGKKAQETKKRAAAEAKDMERRMAIQKKVNAKKAQKMRQTTGPGSRRSTRLKEMGVARPGTRKSTRKK